MSEDSSLEQERTQGEGIEKETASCDELSKTSDLKILQAQLEETERERDHFRNLAQRSQADFINYKRRADEEHQELVRHASSRFIVKLLPILDDFRRALDHQPADSDERQWVDGVILIERKVHGMLEAEGVTRIEAKGFQFDPRRHEAILDEETEQEPEGTVLRVIRDGYIMNDRVLRAAQVSVAKAKGWSDPAMDNHGEFQNDNPQ